MRTVALPHIIMELCWPHLVNKIHGAHSICLSWGKYDEGCRYGGRTETHSHIQCVCKGGGNPQPAVKAPVAFWWGRQTGSVGPRQSSTACALVSFWGPRTRRDTPFQSILLHVLFWLWKIKLDSSFLSFFFFFIFIIGWGKLADSSMMVTLQFKRHFKARTRTRGGKKNKQTWMVLEGAGFSVWPILKLWAPNMLQQTN